MTTCERNNTKWWYFQHFSFISRLWNWASFQFHNLAGRLPPGSFDSVPVQCASTKFSQFFTFFNLAIWQPGCPPYPWPHLPQFEHIHNLGLNWRRFVETHHFTKCDPAYFKPLRWSYTTTSPFTTSQPLLLKIWVAPNFVEHRKKIAWLWFQLFLHLENSWMHFSTLFCNLRTAIWWAKEYLQILFCQNSYCIEF